MQFTFSIFMTKKEKHWTRCHGVAARMNRSQFKHVVAAISITMVRHGQPWLTTTIVPMEGRTINLRDSFSIENVRLFTVRWFNSITHTHSSHARNGFNSIFHLGSTQITSRENMRHGMESLWFSLECELTLCQPDSLCFKFLRRAEQIQFRHSRTVVA